MQIYAGVICVYEIWRRMHSGLFDALFTHVRLAED